MQASVGAKNRIGDITAKVRDLTRSAKMAVTKFRIAELRYNPLTGGPEH